MEDRLRKFAALVDAGSFTKAAKELHLSQPALSTSIAKLERELHTELLVHGSRPLELTDAGRLAYETAQQLSAQTKSLGEQLASLKRKQQNFSVGMIDSVASTMFAAGDPLEDVERQVDVSIVVNNSRLLLEAVAAGKLDLALITTRGKRTHDDLAVFFVGNEPLVLVCHDDLRAKTEQELARGKLQRFIAYDQPSMTGKLVADALHEHDVTARTHFSSTSPEVMLRLVLLKKGAAVLPYLLVRELLEDSTLCAPRGIIVERRISCVVKGQASNAALQRMTSAVRASLRQLETEARAALNNLDADALRVI